MRTRTRTSPTLAVAVLFGTVSSLLAADEPYRVVAEQSRFTVHVGRAGLFKMFGHDHTIEVRTFRGTVDWNGTRPEESKFRLEVDAASLTVADEGLSDDDRKQVQSDMEAKALALPEHAAVVFESTEVRVERTEGAVLRLKVRGVLALRGRSRPLEVPLTLSLAADRLRATGELELESGDWGVPQISAAGGTVKTKQELELAFDLVALR